MNGARYGVEVAEFTPAFISGMDTDYLLTTMVNSFASSASGTVVSSEAATEAGNAARDAIITAAGGVLNVRLWFIGTRMYVLLTEATEGLAVYPQHFYAVFTLK